MRILSYGKQIYFAFTAVLLLLYPLPVQSRGGEVKLSAQQAIEMARKNNRTLRSLEHKLKASNYGVKSAFTGFLPHASLSGTYTRKSGNDMFSKFLGSVLKNSYDIGLDIQQPVFNGFATLNKIRSARVSRTLQETTNDKNGHTIQYSVLQIYRGLINLQKSQTVANEAVRQLEELTSNQIAMMDQGMATEHDYLLTNASLAQARMNELEVGKTVSSMKRQFAILLGLEVGSEIILTDTTTVQSVREIPDIDSAITTTLQNRSDLKEARLQLQLSNYGVKLTRSAYYPALIAGFSYSNSRPDQTLQDQWGNDWNAYVLFNFDLFDWGDRVFKVKKAKEEHLSLLALYEQKKASVEKEVLDAYQTVEQSSKELEAVELLAEARKKAYEASLAKHEEGIIPMYELLDAHSAFVSAKYQALQAATNLELAVVNLAMGGLGTSQMSR